jgi:hypothetical protein
MGVIYKAYKSDAIVLSDDVCYSKKGMHNWNVIRVKNGSQKITVPVNAHHDTKLCDIMISEPRKTLPKIVRTLEETYSKTKHSEEGQEILDIIRGMAVDGTGLVELNITIIKHILDRMGIARDVAVATRDLRLTGHKDDRILIMCEKMGADTYYSGTGAKAYHDETRYREKGINLAYSDYEPVVYRQKYEPFLPNMSVIDYIFNEGYRIPEVWL